MILDCFTFYNEYDILEGRLEYLYDYIDYFIIVETDITHSGKPKPLNYLENISRYKKYHNKIIYSPFSANFENVNFDVIVERTDFSTPHWKIENVQRNHIAEVLKLFDPDDIVMISDADEIPNKSAIEFAKPHLGNVATSFALEQILYYYNFSQREEVTWKGTILTKNKVVQEHTPQWLRDMRWEIPRLQNAGWHLSFWGNAEKIANKIQNFAHQEHNKPVFTNLNNIRDRVTSGRDPFDRHPLLPVDPSTIPVDIYNIFNKYAPVV
jgi:beta-1,4-mannosyl-glycoprotein beta-1,4-N-acetylglucosaminyltransferase